MLFYMTGGRLISILQTAQYGSGSFDGKEYIDTVTLGAGFAINNQSIGVAYYSSGFNGVDGILGIGPVDLTCGTLFPARSSCIPTVTNNAFEQRLISNESIGISFVPTTTPDIIDGALTFGSADTSKYTGDITYVDITSTSPANRYVGIDQSITYGQGGPTILPETAGIVDTGTTLLMISSGAQ
ncbi:Polyporopepsin [Trametes pubescens]|uniref:Polyporopepsin n=1 Tax=Trametes pubescens TaxID=154538 RepID=A0A1M2VCB6_TRAPU|nr:Polyporopepsin [Trametes pubescens]